MSNMATPMYSDKTRGGKFPQMVEHKKKVSDQAGACMRTKGKKKNGSIRRRARLADWFVNVKFNEEARSGQAEAAEDLNTKSSNERVFILTQTHSMQIFGEIPFIKPQNDTRVKAAQRSDLFVLYLLINGQPMAKSKILRYVHGQSCELQ